jgi:ribosomal protein L7/L12
MPDISPHVLDEINELIFSGHTIDAIKKHREVTGLDLKESKDLIELQIKTLLDEKPEKFSEKLRRRLTRYFG